MTLYYLKGFIDRSNDLIASLQGRITELESNVLLLYPELREYCDRRLAVGDPVSAGEQAALQKFLYHPYDDGDGGTLTVASFLTLFGGDNAGLFPLMGNSLIGQTVPLAGNGGVNLIPYNATDGHRRNTGIQGDGSLYLETGIIPSQITFSDFHLTVSMTLNKNSIFQRIIQGSSANLQVLQGVSNLISFTLCGDTLVDSVTPGGGIWAYNATASLAALYRGNTVIDSSTNGYSASSDTSLSFGTAGAPFRGLLGMVQIANSALTDQQRTALYHATTQLNADRELLP